VKFTTGSDITNFQLLSGCGRTASLDDSYYFAVYNGYGYFVLVYNNNISYVNNVVLAENTTYTFIMSTNGTEYINTVNGGNLKSNIYPAINPTLNHLVGANVHLNNYFFTGSIDFQATFNRSFTAEEHKQIYEMLAGGITKTEVEILDDAYVGKVGVTTSYVQSSEIYFEYNNAHYAEIQSGLAVGTKLKLCWHNTWHGDKVLLLDKLKYYKLPYVLLRYFLYNYNYDKIPPKAIEVSSVSYIDLDYDQTICTTSTTSQLWVKYNTELPDLHLENIRGSTYSFLLYSLNASHPIGDIASLNWITYYLLLLNPTSPDVYGDISGLQARTIRLDKFPNVSGVIPSTILTKILYLRYCGLSQADVDNNILARDASGVENGYLDLTGTHIPSNTTAVNDAIASLNGKGWTLYLDS
jgi:hypothetical protein